MSKFVRSRLITDPMQDLLNKFSPGHLRFGGARMALLDVEAGVWGLRRQLEALIGPRLTNFVFQQAGANGGHSFAKSFTDEAVGDPVSLFHACLNAFELAGFGNFVLTDAQWPLGHLHIHATDTFESWMWQQHQQTSDQPICAYSAGVMVGFINAVSRRRDIVCVERTCQARGDDACTFELLPREEASDTAVVSFDPDPLLSQQLNLLDILFDRMPMGIAIFDKDLHIRRINPTWAGFIEKYTAVSTTDVAPGIHYFDLLPDLRDNFQPLFDRVLAGETIQATALPATSNGITSYWDVVFSPLEDNGKVVGILDVAIDATERQQTLSQLQQSDAHLRSLLESAKGYAVYRVAVASDKPYFGDVELVSPSMRDVIGITDASDFANWFSDIHPDDAERVINANQRAMAEGIPFDETMRFYNHRRQTWRWLHTVSHPVHAADGRLTHFNGLVIDVTNQKEAETALAQMNEMLEQKVTERTRELETLLEVSQNVASTLELEPLLGLVLDQLRSVVEYDGASIFELHHDELRLIAYRGPIPAHSALRLVFPLDQAGANQAVINEKRPFIISDIYNDDPMARAFRETAGDELETSFAYLRTWMGVPLILRGRVLGMISLDHGQSNFYDEQSAQLAQAFASQVAIFIENARLYQQEHERRRIAESLRDILARLNSTLPLPEVMDFIATQASQLLGPKSAVAIYRIDRHNKEAVLNAHHGLPSELSAIHALPLAVTGPELVSERQPMVVPDVTKNWFTSPDEKIPDHARKALDLMRNTYRSYLAVPLVVGGEVYGGMAFHYPQKRAFTKEDVDLAQTLGNQVALAIENARLYEQEQERRRVAEGLRDVLRLINAAMPLADTLDAIVQQAAQLLRADVGILHRIDYEDDFVTIEASTNLPPAVQHITGFPLESSKSDRQILQRQPVYKSQVTSLPIDPNKAAEWPEDVRHWRLTMNEAYPAFFAAPLVVQDEVYGSLAFYYTKPQTFDEDTIGLAMALASQAGLAIETARLRQQTEQMAVIAERNRLARELHDAVTQTLFSASLIADVLPRLWQKNPDVAQTRLDDLRELTRGALAEMRTLLLELRPATLTESSLGELLQQLTAATIGRTRLPVTLTLRGERSLSPDIQVALYRIAQEALNNISKHAEATAVDMTLTFTEDTVTLVVADNGRGFDAADVGIQSLGLSIMQERAEKIGATLDITSKPGSGTIIRVQTEA